MSEVRIRVGRERAGFSMLYHEIFDRYHEYIGDKATLYYLYLLRSRNNEKEKANYGKSWRGRQGVSEKFQLSFSTLPLLDDILVAVGLIELEYRPSGRGHDKIYYVVNDALTDAEFDEEEPKIVERLSDLIARKPKALSLLGKEKGRKLQ